MKTRGDPVRIETLAHLHQLAEVLGGQDACLARALDDAGPLPDRSRAANFETLLSIIVSQQVSLASAAAIWRRIEKVLPDVTAEAYLKLPVSQVDKLGLSKQKKIYAEGLARDALEGRLVIEDLQTLDDDQAMEALRSTKGIGRWSAEVFLLFALGRSNVWPAQDIALQSAVQDLHKLDTRPTVEEMDEIAQTWSPLRGVAAQILWAYYRHMMVNPRG